MNLYIVAWDPRGKIPEGSLLQQGHPKALAAENAGVVLLPCDQDFIMQQGALSGYFRRSWGKGVNIDSSTPRLHCPLALYAPHDARVAWWAARVIPMDTASRITIETGRALGGLRLAGDSGQQVGDAGSILPHSSDATDARELEAADALGGWTIGGRALLARSGGLLAFSLYGQIPGAIVEWAAITVARGE